MNTIQKLRARLREINTEIRGMAEAAEDENRELRASEQRQYNALREERGKVESRLAQLEGEEHAREADAEARRTLGGGGSFGRGADTVYGRESGNSYFLDLAASAMPGSPVAWEASQRLAEHAQVVERASTDLPHAWRASFHGPEKRVNPNRTDGQGGYFVPPLWMVEEYVAMLRAGRALADRCRKMDLPSGTDSINLPKVASGTAVGVQLDNGAVTSQDLTDDFLSAPVRTIAGQQDVALQMLEQSPINFDEVVFADLIADYNQKLDAQVLSGTGANGQMKGLTTVTGINTVPYTSTTPTVPELYTPLGQAASQVAAKRFLAPDTIGMRPERWWWIASALDNQNRPLVEPHGGSGMNLVAVSDPRAAEGVAGAISGVPVVVDANLPNNLGTGTNQDTILTGRFQDFYLWEGALRTRALVEVLSGTLQVRLQVYNYAAFMPDRYPTALSQVTGTGLVMPAGY